MLLVCDSFYEMCVPCRSVGQVDEVLAVVADKEHAIRNGLTASSMTHAEIVLTCVLHSKWSKS